MAQLDGSMYLRDLYGEPADLAGSFERGMKVGDAFKKRQADALMKEAYQKGVTTNPDGSTSFNADKTVSELYGKGMAKEAQEFQSQYQKQALEKQKMNFETQATKIKGGYQLLNTVKDQPSLEYARKQALGLGYSQEEIDKNLPSVFDKNVIETAKYQLGEASRSFDEMMADQRARENMAARLAETQQNNDFRRQEVGLRRLERQDARELRQDEKEQKLMTPYGLARTDMDAKDLKSADEEKKGFDSKLNELIKLREDFGGELVDREAVSRAKQLSKDLLLSYKNMAKLGVLSQSDTDIINAIIPADPLEYRSPLAAIQGQDPILSNMKKFKSDSDMDFQNKLQNRLRSAPVQQTSAPAPGGLDVKIQNFMKKNGIQDPNEAMRILKENGRL